MPISSSTVSQDVFTNTEPPQRKRKVEITTAPERSDPASECSAAVKNGRGCIPTSDQSSDEDEVDPILMKECLRQLRESDGFDVDTSILSMSLSVTKCDNKPGLYGDMIDVYARVGLHCYNFHKGSNFQFSSVTKFVSCAIFENYITLEARDPANNSCFTFQACVIRADCRNGAALRITTNGCRIKPQVPGTGDVIHHEWENIDQDYKGNLPKWYSDGALMPSGGDKHHQFYQLQDSDIRENDWLVTYAEIALYSLREGDMTSSLKSWLPLEIKEVVVQTYDEDVMPKAKLKSGNAIIYISFTNLNAPPNGLLQDHRAIVRRTTDGIPGHLSLEFKCWPQE